MTCSRVCSWDHLQAHDTNCIVISRLTSPLEASTPNLGIFIWVKYQWEIQYRSTSSISNFLGEKKIIIYPGTVLITVSYWLSETCRISDLVNWKEKFIKSTAKMYLRDYLTCVAFIQCVMACWTNFYIMVSLWSSYLQFDFLFCFCFYLMYMAKSCIYVCNSLKVTRKLVSANTQNVYSGKNSEVYGIVLKNINICLCCLQTAWLVKLVVSNLCTKRNSS